VRTPGDQRAGGHELGSDIRQAGRLRVRLRVPSSDGNEGDDYGRSALTPRRSDGKVPPMTGGSDRTRATPRLTAVVALTLLWTFAASESRAHPPRAAQPSGHEKSEGVALTSEQRRETVR